MRTNEIPLTDQDYRSLIEAVNEPNLERIVEPITVNGTNEVDG